MWFYQSLTYIKIVEWYYQNVLKLVKEKQFLFASVNYLTALNWMFFYLTKVYFTIANLSIIPGHSCQGEIIVKNQFGLSVFYFQLLRCIIQILKPSNDPH